MVYMISQAQHDVYIFFYSIIYSHCHFNSVTNVLLLESWCISNIFITTGGFMYTLSLLYYITNTQRLFIYSCVVYSFCGCLLLNIPRHIKGRLLIINGRTTLRRVPTEHTCCSPGFLTIIIITYLHMYWCTHAHIYTYWSLDCRHIIY